MPTPLSRTLFRPDRPPFWRRWSWILFGLGLALLATSGWFAYWALSPIGLGGKPSAEIYVSSGASLRSVRRELSKAGADLPEYPFLLLAKIFRNDRSIRVGAYEILPGLSPWRILQQLNQGKVVQGGITIPEGWTFAQIRARVESNANLASQTRPMSEAELLAAVGASESSAEGLFFPDSYAFDKHSSDLALYRRMYREGRRRLSEAWAERSPDTPLKSPYEALILASIIEKESGVEADRQLIGAVFNNRLRSGMRLQSDPTVIYGMGQGFDGNLRKRDLGTPTPYNTYVIRGLPPTPIASASQASLLAAVRPAASQALYFVARGDGSSEFSNNLSDHNLAVRKYQLKRAGP